VWKNEKFLGGSKYMLIIIDDNTRYVWIYFLKTKDEVFKYFMLWKAMVEKSTGRKVKTLRSDNGGEYTSKQFQDYLDSEGVKHERTIPKTPQQNGVAERFNRTIIEMVRTMLIQSKLPQKFWAEALATAVHLRNISPTKAVDCMTPYQALNGRRPNVSYLRPFGCVAYVHIPKDEQKKLDNTGKKCILMGYGKNIKGYRLYDPESGKMIHSRWCRQRTTTLNVCGRLPVNLQI